MRRLLFNLLLAAGVGATTMAAVSAGEFSTTVPMTDGGASTFYVPAHIDGVGEVRMMVDTGAGYSTINEEALKVLLEQNKAQFVRNLRGVLANGETMTVPVYRIAALTIGDACRLENVQAAVFPGNTRFLLGLSVLKETSPFIFSTDPANLVLSNCSPPYVASKEE